MPSRTYTVLHNHSLVDAHGVGSRPAPQVAQQTALQVTLPPLPQRRDAAMRVQRLPGVGLLSGMATSARLEQPTACPSSLTVAHATSTVERFPPRLCRCRLPR